MILYLLHYNNYYNRIVKKEDTLNAYLDYLIGNPIQKVNFVPNDYINTTQIINWNDQHPDYLLAVTEEGKIDSRWFVVSTDRTRNGQLLLTLHRDLVVDFYDQTINAPCFIEKATVSDDDPAIFNNENMSFNQILTNSTPLMDETQSPWLVGYFAKNTTIEDLDINYESDLVPDYLVSSLNDLPFYQYLNKTYTNFGDVAIDVIARGGSTSNRTLYMNSFNRFGAVNPPAKAKNYTVENGFAYITEGTSEENRTGYFAQMLGYIDKTPLTGSEVQTGSTGGIVNIPIYISAAKRFTPYLVNAIPSTTWSTIDEQVRIYTGNINTSEINQYVNKIVKLTSGKYYKVLLRTEGAASDFSAPIPAYNIPNIDRIVRNAYNSAMNGYKKNEPTISAGMSASVNATGTSANDFVCTIRTSASSKATLYLEEITDTRLSAKLNTAPTHLHLTDAPYDMFCMPYSDDVTIHTKDGDFKSNKILSFAVMNAIAEKYGGSTNLYDIQLLPYCPLRNYISGTKRLDLTLASSLSTGVDQYYYVLDETGVAKLGVFMYCGSSQDTFDINYRIPITNYKIQSECDMYRLCSPNYSSIFEFNAAKNRGVEKFNVDFSYKPFTPYIHLNPNFKATGLYGLDRNEPRGLICGGDFSISMVNDQFATYELQNKNYQLSFQRQIENMEVKNDIQRTQDMVSIFTGALTGAGGGAALGMMVGGPIGAAVGGVGGALASVGGGVGDYLLNEKLRNEALDYTKDQFGYQLGNIQALPNTIAKVTTFNPNNKIFPVLEYYTCTDIEKEALENKIKYNGMTVMRISTIQNFRKVDKTYIKGKIIRFAGDNVNLELDEDSHIANAIANEIYQGVYI